MSAEALSSGMLPGETPDGCKSPNTNYTHENSIDLAFEVAKVSSLAMPALFLGLFFACSTLAQNACAGDKCIVGYCISLIYNDTTISAPSTPPTSEYEDACRGVLTDARD